MLSINKVASMRISLINSYKSCVINRIGNEYWKIPKMWSCVIDRVLGICETIGIYSPEDINNFVNAQFFYLDKNFCKKAFGTLYPPLTVLLSKNARHRYRKHVLKEDSFESRNKTLDSIKEAAIKEIKTKIDLLTDDDIIFSIVNGTINIWSLAFYTNSEHIKRRIIGVLNECKKLMPDDVIGEYESACEIINKMGKNCDNKN